MQILYEELVHIIIFTGTADKCFCVFVLPLLALLLLLKEFRGNFAVDFGEVRKEV